MKILKVLAAGLAAFVLGPPPPNPFDGILMEF